jgi:hypothetical protein
MMTMKDLMTHTKDEALALALGWQKKDWNSESPMSADSAISEANDVINALMQALAAQPAPVQKRPQNCGTGYCSCIECVMEPAVPDAFGTREGEHPQYVQGWNDCRAETLKMRKP